ncbi:putative DNA-dependent ATPase [Giardia muris]|nr:putative DNA-dependent ATPase [Giardia muris]|eukprot:TNJ29609.1 putative DNA-dependent ATPase [Giardia muris]
MNLVRFRDKPLRQKLATVFGQTVLSDGGDTLQTVPSMRQLSKRSAGKGDESDSDGPVATVDKAPDLEVLSQPHCLTGGLLKEYQLESLQWLIGIHQTCTRFRLHFTDLPENPRDLIPFSNGRRAKLYSDINAAQVGCILGDEMGLGKTIQTISLLAFLHEHLDVRQPHLVIVPKSTLTQWHDEFKKWAPCLKILVVIGDRETREELIQQNFLDKGPLPDVCLTTYDVVRLERKALSSVFWYYMVLDEGHKLKDTESQISIALRGYTTMHKLLLTGTPLQNNLHELWALLNFLSPLIFDKPGEFVGLVKATEEEAVQMSSSKSQPKLENTGGIEFRTTPVMSDESSSDESTTQTAITANTTNTGTTGTATTNIKDTVSEKSPTTIGRKDVEPKMEGEMVPSTGEDGSVAARMHDVLKLFLLRREKKDVESLPQKHEYLINCGMTTLQRELYKGVLSKDLSSLNKVLRSTSETSAVGKTSLVNVIMQLRKCSDHPYLFPGVEPEPFKEGEHIINVSGKMVIMDKIIVRIKSIGEKVLVFCQMTSMLNIIEDYLRFRGYAYCRIDGSTDLETRARSMALFNNPASEAFVFLLSTRAGCLGLNLTAANHVIIYQQDFNPQADLQAVARAYRLLQTKEVFVYRLIAENTVDTRIYERAQVKLGLDNLIIQSGNFTNSGQLNKLLGDTELRGRSMSRNQLLDMIAVSSESLFTIERTEEKHDYDIPEITIDDAKLEELLQNALRRREDVSKRITQKVADASSILSQLASDGKLEHVNTDQLYQFEGQSYTKQSMRRIADLLQKEKDGKDEAERALRIANYSLMREEGDTAARKKDKRHFPTLRRLKMAANVYKADIQLLAPEYYLLIGKIATEISTVIEPHMAEHPDLSYEDFATERGYARPDLPGLTPDELETLYSYLGTGCPYLDDNKEISRREFNTLMGAFCDYEVEKYASMTGVRRLQYTPASRSTDGEQDTESEHRRILAELPAAPGFHFDKCYNIEVSGLENMEIVYLVFAEKMRAGKESALRLTKQEIVRYCTALLENLDRIEDGAKIRQRIERARQRRRTYFKRVRILRRWIDQYTDPLYQLPIPSVTNQRRTFSDLQDRFLLLMIDACGLGCWHEVATQIRLSPLFAMDWWFKTRTEEELSKRADRLLKYIEQDIGDISDSEGDAQLIQPRTRKSKI